MCDLIYKSLFLFFLLFCDFLQLLRFHIHLLSFNITGFVVCDHLICFLKPVLLVWLRFMTWLWGLYCWQFCDVGLSLVPYEGLEVINPEGGTEDAEEEAKKGRWKEEVYYLLSPSLCCLVHWNKKKGDNSQGLHSWVSKWNEDPIRNEWKNHESKQIYYVRKLFHCGDWSNLDSFIDTKVLLPIVITY